MTLEEGLCCDCGVTGGGTVVEGLCCWNGCVMTVW